MKELGRKAKRTALRLLHDPDEPGSRRLVQHARQRPWGHLLLCAVLPVVPAGGLTVAVGTAATRTPAAPWWAGPLELLTLVVSYLLLVLLLLHLLPRTRAHLRQQRTWGRIEARRHPRVRPGWRETAWTEAYVIRRVVFDLLGPGDDD